MKTGKILTIITLTSLLVACSSNKDSEKVTEQAVNEMYQLPSKPDYEKAARLNIELALGYLKQEQISRAKAKFLRAKELAPELPEVHYSYAYFLETVGQMPDAKKAYEKAISLNSKNGQSHHVYGAFLCRQKQYSQSEKEFLLAVEDQAFGHTAEAYESAGICVLENKETAKAITYFEKALRYDPNRPNALLELAFVRLKQGNRDQARQYYEKYSQIAKPNARSKKLATELARA